MPTPSASDLSHARVDPASAGLQPAGIVPATVARFSADLARLIDPARDRVLVALSGGADSIALLLLTHAVLGERCSAATVDHGLRPAAAEEARSAAQLCADRGIAHAILRGPLPERAGRTANVSARARDLRYRLLSEQLSADGADWLATAHHADDQLETTLMRLNRGAGVAGLAGIRASGWRTIRPLLGWRRDALAAIVARAGIVPVADPSNTDDRYDRARMRKALAGADWLDAERVVTSAAALAEADEALAWSAQELAATRTREEGETLTLDPAGVPAELVRRLFRGCLQRIDADSAPDGPALTRAIAALGAGQAVTLGRVLVRPGPAWTFRLAPPRRTG